ncbi:hypothetical protein [Caudoviricetes sp.]|nr:hypothetical protein [Caudoviricetes sp.]
MTASVSSITRAGTFEPFDLQVPRGQVYGHSTVNIYGFQPAVTTTQIPLWENATAYTFPGSAVAMTVASAAGATDSGVKIQVQGLDANYNALNETVTLNASGTATTTGLFLRINALVTTSGNATGIVTAKNGGTTYAQINVGFGRSLMSIYTVPKGFDFYLARVAGNSSFNGNNTNYLFYQNLSTNNGVNIVTTKAPFTTAYDARRVMPRKFTEKTDLQFLFNTSASTAAVNIAVEGYLVQADVLTNVTP